MDVRKRDRLLRELGITEWIRRREAVPPGTLVAQPLGMASHAAPDAGSAAGDEPESDARLMKEAIDRPEVSELQLKHVSWGELQATVDQCVACGLARTRNKAVFGIGPEKAPLMVIGEGPGADEDARGEPFVGRAGKLLDEMLKAIGCSRSDNTYVTNVVKCRPPGNRDPLVEEAEACRSYLDRQIEFVSPRLIVGLGRIAAQRLLSTELPLSKLRGRIHQYGKNATPVVLTYHPAYLLRSPREKAKAWTDLKSIYRFLQSRE